MGNFKFKLSDMMPNSWFYKLRDMGAKRKNQSKIKKESPLPSTTPQSRSTFKTDQFLLHSQPRRSQYFTRELVSGIIDHDQLGNDDSPPSDTTLYFLPDPPRKSSKQKQRRRPTNRTPPRIVNSSSCSSAIDSPPPPPYELPSLPSHRTKFRSDPAALLTQSIEFTCHKYNSNPDGDGDGDGDASVTQKKKKISTKRIDKPVDELPPIMTSNGVSSVSPAVEITENERTFSKEQRNSPSRRFTVSSQVRVNSPRISSKRFNHQRQGHRRKSVSSSSSSSSKRNVTDSSLAIVKSSNDPQRDFRESMVEMIVENKINGSNELEDLLACYLSLNTDEYHDVIINVFKQIWFDMTDTGNGIK